MQALAPADILRLETLFATAKRACIVVHTHPDGDAIGSGAALLAYLRRCRHTDATLLLPDSAPDTLGFLLPEEGLVDAACAPQEAAARIAACDLLVPGVGEIVGGSQREERYDVLLDKIRKNGMDEETYWWYLELRKYGGCKHAGFGLGFERMIMYLTGVDNIRDVLPFPRTPKNADF